MKSRLISLVLAVLAATALTCAAAPAVPGNVMPPQRQLTATQAHADIALLRLAFEQAHAGLYRYAGKPAIDAAFARLQHSADAGIGELALYRALSLFVATIRCDHTKVEFSDRITQLRRDTPTHLPFRFKLIDQRMMVYSSDPAQPALPRGSEIVAINGRAVSAILRALRPAVSIDGYTEASREAKLAADSDLMGSDFDQLYPSFFGYAGQFTLQWRATPAAPVREVSLRALTFRDWVNLPWSAAANRDEFYKSVTFKLLPRHTALLKIDSFVNYRNPVDASAYYAAFFATLKAQEITTLILDLRDNGGGSTDAAQALAAHLLARPFTWTKPILQKAIRYGDWTGLVETWGDRQQLFAPPAADFIARDDGWFERRDAAASVPLPVAAQRFDGRVIALTGPANASGVTMLLAKLKDEGRITTVGQATGGSAEGPTAGQILLLSLPASGLKVRLPLYWSRMDIARFAPGLGVPADIDITPTAADMAAGRDAVLAAALALPPE